MARKKRSQHSRTQAPNQTSTLFDLPREIRNLIYATALTKSDPIDLAPCRYLTPDEKRASPEIMTRLLKLPPWNFRDRRPIEERINVIWVQDLEFVRQNLSPNLLATCTKIYDEAWPHFWQNNVWRFSSYWNQTIVLRRFLSTIGPRARTQIRNVEFMLWPTNDAMLETVQHISTPRDDSRGAKSHPKLRLSKNRGEENYFRDGRYTPVRWFADPIIRDWLLHESSEPRMRFFLGAPSTLVEHNIEREWAISNIFERSMTFTSLDFPRDGGMSWLKCVLVAERGSTLMGKGLIKLLNELGVDVILKEGSYLPAADDDFRRVQIERLAGDGEVLREIIVRAPLLGDDILYGVRDLYHEPEKGMLPARGGRALKGDLRNPARVLRGFGGCRFEDAKENWYCCLCGSKAAVLVKPKGKRPRCYFPSPQPRNCNRSTNRVPNSNCYFVKLEGIVLKKYPRAQAAGIVDGQYRGQRQINP